MSNGPSDKIKMAYASGKINQYMLGRLSRISNTGVTDEVMDSVVQDAEDASNAGITSDKEYALYFFVNHFVDDILDDTFGIILDPEEKKDLCLYIISHKNDENYKFDDLTDFRILTHKWLSDKALGKKAYPNVSMQKREPVCDLDRWITTLKNIYADMYIQQLSKPLALDRHTADWDVDEKQKFVNWMRYYESGNTEKYNVKNANFKKEAFGEAPQMPSVPASWINPQNRQDPGIQMSTYKVPDTRTKREQEMDLAKAYKTKMKGRVQSLRKLLHKFNDIMSSQDVDKIYDEINNLEKTVSKLTIYATMQDCTIRTANKLHKLGFVEGSDFLHKVAEEPINNSVLTSLPQPQESPNPDLPRGSALVSINTVISRLEGVSKMLKSRDTIRELASIDILLNELGIASYFPEITDAQAKLIESFGYASNKIESIVAKLRGTGKETSKPPPAPAPAPVMPPMPTVPGIPVAPTKVEPPKINTEEIAERPIGRIERKLPPPTK